MSSSIRDEIGSDLNLDKTAVCFLAPVIQSIILAGDLKLKVQDTHVPLSVMPSSPTRLKWSEVH